MFYFILTTSIHFSISAMLAYDCATVGRGGEVFFANWGSAYWNTIEQVLETETFEPKTGKLQEAAVCRDK